MARRRTDDDYDDDDYDGGPLEPHRGVMILVLGLISVLVCGLLGPFAWSMGKADLRKMDAGQMDRSGRNETQAGYICGIIGTVLLILSALGALLWLLMVFVFVGAAANAR